jgi:hypothetical protein
MLRFAAPLLLAAAITVGSVGVAPQPAEARSGRNIAGFAVGALVTGLVVNEIYRSQRRRHYAHRPHYAYGYDYQPQYYYSHQPRYYHRPHYRYGW